jgi:hypothetical protein
MKKITKILVLVAMVSLFAVSKSKAQISVQLQLTRPPQYENNERLRPNRPSPNHVWISEEWVPNGNGGYNYQPGHWVQLPKEQWIQGHWVPAQGGGYTWLPGFWQVLYHDHWVAIPN